MNGNCKFCAAAFVMQFVATLLFVLTAKNHIIMKNMKIVKQIRNFQGKTNSLINFTNISLQKRKKYSEHSTGNKNR